MTWLRMGACCVFGWAGGCAAEGGAEGEDWPEAWVAFEDRVVELVNEHRAAGATCGSQAMAGDQGALASDDVLRGAARALSEDMAARGFFDHVDPDGNDPQDRLSAAGFGGGYPWGENIAKGAPDPETVVQGWLDSPPHCQNILLPDYGVIGVGYYAVEGDTGGHWWTQEFAGSH
jgi:uncharacterized protein YkwD